MVCIYCGHKTAVTNSRTSKQSAATWRRRECTTCHSTITTRESIDYATAVHVKDSSGDSQPLNRDKLFISLHASLTHRSSALEDASDLAATILAELTKLQVNGVLHKKTITETAHRVLERFDKVAAVHYAAHHKI